MAGHAGQVDPFPIGVDDERSALERCRSLLGSVSDGLYQLDTEGRIVAVNDGILELTGYAREELLGAHASTFIAGGDVATAESTIRAMLENDLETATLEVDLERADGRTVRCRLRMSPLLSDGEFRGTVGAIRDLSVGGEGTDGTGRRHRDQDALRRELEEVFERVDDAFYALDDRFRFTYVNDRAEELLEAPEEELLGERLWDRFPAAAETDAWEALHAALESQESTDFEIYFEPLDFRAEANVYPSETGLSVYFRDVTERVRREQELQRTERRFEAIFEDPNILVGLLDPDGTVLDVNRTALEYVDADLAEVVGEPFPETPWWDEDEEVRATVRESIERAADGEYVDFEADLTRPDGREYAVDGVFRPVTDDDGEVVSIVVSDRDVTERKERERALEKSEGRYRALAEFFPNGIVTLFDEELRYTLAAGRGFERTDGEPEDLEGKGVREVWGEATADALEPVLRAALDGETGAVELAYEGREWVVHAVPITDEDGEVFAGMTMAQDITEREELQTQLREHNRALRRLYGIGADAERSFDERVDAVLELGREYLDLEVGFLATVDESAERFEIVRAAGDDERFEPGAAVPLEETYCRKTLATDGLQRVENAPEEGWSDDPAYERWDLGCYLGGTVRVDGDRYGTLCFVEENPRESSFTDAEQRFVELATQWVSYELERQRHERELREYREYTDETLDAIDDVFYTVDETGTFTRWNESLTSVTGYDDEEIAAMSPVEFVAAEDRERLAEEMAAVFETGSARVEARVLTKDGEEIPYEFVATRVEAPDGTPRLTGVGRDVSERKEREGELEQYRALTEAANDVIVTIDDESAIRSVNPAVEEVFGYDPDGLIGESLTELMPERCVEPHRAALQRYLRTGQRRLEWEYVELPGERADGSELPLAVSFSEVEHDGDRFFTGIVRDITERREHEAELQRRQRQQEVVADLGQFALETDDLDDLMGEAARLVAETLEADYCKVLQLDRTAEELLVRQGVGWREGTVGSATVAADGDSQAGYTLRSEAPVVVEDLDAETRFSGPALLSSHDVTSGVSTVVGSVDAPWGILGVHDTDRREFTDEDVNFVQSVANVLATAIDRVTRERQLERHRERLEAINSLHEVVHGVTEAVIERSTREEIERAVCERLAASESYRFAWIGEVDTPSQRVTPRASAGVDGYLEEIEISIDPDDELSNGPAGRAYLTGEVQTCQQVRTDPRFEPWREQAETYGFRSSAAVPIVHEGTVFGVLGVYADRSNAFADEEREVIGHLGEIVGHAIAAAERKRALMSDEMLEVELRIQDVFGAHDPGGPGGRVTFDRVVPIDDEEYHIYGRVAPEARAAVESYPEDIPHWESIRFRGDPDEEAWFELRASDSPLTAIVATHGGVVESSILEDGDLNMRIHLPQGTDVREVIDQVRSRYPNVELLARRRVERPIDASRDLTLALTEELTDRQRTALETAYYAGFFEWPRDSSGEELAAELDIAPATFTQHLRTAERKLFDALFEELPATTTAAE